MKIYIDCDDVITKTGEKLLEIAKRLFDTDITFENMEFFDLKKTFRLNDEQYNRLMAEAHIPDMLLSYEELEGASETINSWVDMGYDVQVITGRPYSTYEPTRKWLDDHGLSRLPLFHLDKYGRDIFTDDSTFSMTLDDFYTMDFDFVVEDSPMSFKHLSHFKNCTVAVYDRPWNKNAELPGENYQRCFSWKDVDALLKERIS